MPVCVYTLYITSLYYSKWNRWFPSYVTLCTQFPLLCAAPLASTGPFHPPWCSPRCIKTASFVGTWENHFVMIVDWLQGRPCKRGPLYHTGYYTVQYWLPPSDCFVDLCGYILGVIPGVVTWSCLVAVQARGTFLCWNCVEYWKSLATSKKDNSLISITYMLVFTDWHVNWHHASAPFAPPAPSFCRLLVGTLRNFCSPWNFKVVNKVSPESWRLHLCVHATFWRVHN